MNRSVLCVLLASGVNAGVVVHTVTVNPSLTDWSVTNRVPQFDGRLGTLRSVQVTVDAVVAGRGEYVSLDRGWRLPISLAVTNAVSARVGGLVASRQATSTWAVDVAHQVPAVVTFSWQPSKSAATSQNLAAFVGTSTLPVVTQAATRTWYSGPADFTLRWDTKASAVATVAYTFDGRCEDDGDKDKDSDTDKDGGCK